MKKTLFPLFATLTVAAFAQQPTITPTAPAKPACCAACAAEKTAVPAVLSNRSIYQLDAKWTDDAGRTVELTALRGHPVVLAMFFANCEYACPIIVDDMRRIAASLPENTRAKTQFVLVSFDSARDTPEALKNYRTRMALPTESWTLVRGDTSSVQELAMLLGVKFKQDARGQFSHSNLITVLNPEGEIAHQRAGLQGDVSEAARAVMLAAK
jgi:protein SCO1